jgi:hypothetical protein
MKKVHMCKMLFIGTITVQRVIPFVEARPDFHIEVVSGEFSPVLQVFKNPHIYFVGTSRGCSCDFGIKSNQHSADTLGKTTPAYKYLNKLRKLSGTYSEWKHRHTGRVEKLLCDQAQYLSETLQLVSLIESEAQKGNPVELYCTWLGDYGAKPEFKDMIDTKKVDIKTDFEIAEKEFKTFI